MPNMSERIVYLNGSFIPEQEAGISIFDCALATGEKVVEITRTFNQVPYKLDEHMARLYKGLDTLCIDPGMSPFELREITHETLSRNLKTQPESVDWQILQYISKGPAAQFEIVPEVDLHPTILIHCIPLVNRIGKMAKKYRDGVNLVVVAQRAIPQEIISPQIKSNGRMDHVIGRLQAKQLKPGSTGVLLDTNGYVTEGTGTSLFFISGSEILTAPASKVLTGLTRKMIFDIADTLNIPIQEADLTVEEAKNADEVFITSTVICLLHARTFDSQQIRDGLIGPITRKVQQAFIDEVGLDYVKQAQEYGERLLKDGPVR